MSLLPKDDMPCPTRAYLFLERQEAGLYQRMVSATLAANGIVHAAPDCFCLAIPVRGAEREVCIVFQCSRLPALWALARMYGERFDFVRFRRDFKNKYSERRIAMGKLLAKAGLARVAAASPSADDC